MSNDYPYVATTRSIVVRVRPSYLAEQSDAAAGRYAWAYHIRVENRGRERVQLLNRHWRITDALGRTEEVRGEGVVGKQPVLEPGQAFEYTSGAPLPTPSGIMAGRYEMAGADQQRFWIDVPAFSLDSPYAARSIN
ncbi:MAG: Co2+/Mg2+ efflux protein ApaG [Alphaproteobacteria bacterium]|nr:MAG: Co2+/Mg2+ efflux protein ApaG [Alphaproteobacteria bacterium]